MGLDFEVYKQSEVVPELLVPVDCEVTSTLDLRPKAVCQQRPNSLGAWLRMSAGNRFEKTVSSGSCFIIAGALVTSLLSGLWRRA
jgi:hypothetical protein